MSRSILILCLCALASVRTPTASATVSHPLKASVLPDTTTTAVVVLPLMTAQPGDAVEIPLMLVASNQLDSCSAFDFTVTVSFNRTMLIPVNAATRTPKGNLMEATFRGTRVSGKDTLMLLKFIAALGDKDVTSLHIESVTWNTSCPVKISTSDGEFRPKKICREDGSSRLIVALGLDAALKMRDVYYPDSPRNILFDVLEAGRTEVYITDLTGRRTTTLYQGNVTAGTYSANFDSPTLPSGIYFCTLQTPTQRISRKFIVVR